MTEHCARWWTPDGYVNGPDPVQNREPPNPEGMDWPALLEQMGYESCTLIADQDDDMRCGIELTAYSYQHEDHHRFIELWDISQRLAAFYVAAEHWPAWLMQELPRLRTATAQASAAYSILSIAKTLAAFVRHGHGRDTISEDGLENYEERERAREARDQRRRIKAAQDANQTAKT